MKINMEPCWAYVNSTPLKQAIHIKREADEVLDALHSNDSPGADMEVMDVIQSCVTYLVIRGFSQDTVDKLAAEMHDKNDARGYYKKGE